MKKSMILLGMLSIGYAYAQEGNVGINTSEPKATLEVQPSTENLTKTTNEGIIAPKLTKARIAGIADANLVEGTLVYATDATYAGTNTKVAKITEKGYYFYNGTEWVKAGADNKGALWVERDGNKVNLESSLLNQKVFYTPNGYREIPKDKTTYEFYNSSTNTLGQSNIDDPSITNVNFYTSKHAQPVLGIDGNLEYKFAQNSIEVDELKNNTGTNANIFLKFNNVTIPSSYSQGVRLVRTGNFNATKLNAGNTSELTALFSRSLDAGAGDTQSMIGVSSNVVAQKPSGTISNIYSNLGRTEILAENKANITNLIGLRSYFRILGSGNITNMYAFSPTIDTTSKFTGVVTNYYDYFADGHPGTFNVENRYGIYIKGNNKTNYLQGKLGIGTNAPEELLDVEGEARIGSGGRYNYLGVSSGTSPFGMFLGHNIKRNKQVGYTFTSVAGNADTQKGSSLIYTDVNTGVVTFGNYIKASGLTQEDFLLKDAAYMIAGADKSITLPVLADTSATVDRTVVVDKNGKLKVGSTTSTPAPAVAIGSTTAMECNADNRGKMNFIPSTDNAKSDVFGICMRNKDGNYYWAYMVGGNNPTNGTGAFGSGL